MTQREKVLGAIVVVIVISLGGIWIVNRVVSRFDDRNDELARLKQETEEKEAKVRRGNKAATQLAAWQKLSLPSDRSRARSQYWVWLLDLIEKSGLQVDVKPAGERATGDLYVKHTFNITGHADLRRLIVFLHDFYSVGYLHRITSLSAHPVPDKRDLDISMTIEVISLNKAPETTDGKPPPAQLSLEKDAEKYAAVILGRNVFSLGNNPPRISSLETQRGNPNQPLSFSVKASDPDKLDQHTYALEASQLEGATIDPKTGEFRWTPSKLGNYEVGIRVTDDGYPSKSIVEKIKIEVAEAPPPTKDNPFLKDDPARDAKITAMVGSADKLQVWVTVPRGLGDQPKTLHLNSGDEISVGSFVGVVKQIRTREAEFELKDGRTVIVRLDQPLVSSEKEKTSGL